MAKSLILTNMVTVQCGACRIVYRQREMFDGVQPRCCGSCGSTQIVVTSESETEGRV